jgi:hypothetical protein
VNWAEFAGQACQCLRVEGRMCNLKGTCVEPQFKTGWCEQDLVDYRADSLYYPFVKRQSIPTQKLTLEALEDTYFYIYSQPIPPTQAPQPQQQPTRYPTRNPTKRPLAPDTIVLFSSGLADKNGAVGTRTATTNYCASPLMAPYRPNQCAKGTPLLYSYSGGDQIAGFSSQYLFPTLSPVQGPSGIVISPTWAQFLPPTLTPAFTVLLTNSLVNAGVMSVSQFYWTGSLRDGTVNSGANCLGGTSTSVSGQLGLSGATTANFNSFLTVSCTNSCARVCLCIN